MFSGENWEDCARFSEEWEGKGELCVFYTLSHTIFFFFLCTFSRGGGKEGERDEDRQGGESNMARWENEEGKEGSS